MTDKSNLKYEADFKQILKFSLLLLVLSFLSGCGRKGPPLPFGMMPPPAVSDLKKHIDGYTITLTWSIPQLKKGGNESFSDGFYIYRSKKKEDAVCENCPQRFKLMADIPIVGEKNDRQMSYKETLESGYRYIFKVVAYAKNKVESNDSNIIIFILR